VKKIAGSIAHTPIAKLLGEARLKQYPKGQIVLYDGDMTTDLLILKSGISKIYDIDQHGNEKILHILKPPAIMPVTFFLGTNKVTNWFYGTITDSEMYVLPQTEVERHMQTDSRLAVYLMRWFASETHELLVRLSSLGKTDTRDKLLAALKFLAVRHSIRRFNGWHRVTFPVSHQLLADMIGMTRESTAMVMKRLQEQKLVRCPRLTVLEINFEKILNLDVAMV
jgi:CRP/FNR family transcriptional regulator